MRSINPYLLLALVLPVGAITVLLVIYIMPYIPLIAQLIGAILLAAVVGTGYHLHRRHTAHARRLEAEAREAEARATQIEAETRYLEQERKQLILQPHQSQQQFVATVQAALAVITQGGMLEYSPDGFKASVVYAPGRTVVESVADEQDRKRLAAPPPKILVPSYPAPRDFAEVLRSGFVPSAESIYLMDMMNGPLMSGMYDLCHVGLGGPTGGGKTNLTRILVSQLVYAGASVYFASPNFAQVKLNGRRLEDWRPIVKYLAAPPARETDDIWNLISRFKTTFENRRREEDRTPRRGKDIFLVLGEWPAIVARIEEASDILTLLLRESRQYGVHVVTEMQDALVKSIGVSSGVRDNLRTGSYHGGDPITAKVLLNLGKGESVDETGIGEKGAVFMRTFSSRPQSGRIPFFSNQSLYMLLGAPPDPMPDVEIWEEDRIPETYYQIVEGRYVNAGAPLIVEQDESARVSRRDTDETPAQMASQLTHLTRQTGPLSGLVDRAEEASNERHDYPRMNEIQVAQFVAMYKVRPNKDECLKRIEGCSTRHRQHANELIKLHNLDRRS